MTKTPLEEFEGLYDTQPLPEKGDYFLEGYLSPEALRTIRAALSPKEADQGKAIKTVFAWVIEKKIFWDEKHSPTVYWNGRGVDGKGHTEEEGWTSDPYKAIRFIRKQDANLIFGYIIKDFVNGGSIVEHGWDEPNTAAQPPAYDVNGEQVDFETLKFKRPIPAGQEAMAYGWDECLTFLRMEGYQITRAEAAMKPAYERIEGLDSRIRRKCILVYEAHETFLVSGNTETEVREKVDAELNRLNATLHSMEDL